MNRRDFLRKTCQVTAGGLIAGTTAQAGYLLSNNALECRLGPRPQNQFPQLDRVGNNFSFVLVADPQLNIYHGIGSVPGTSSVRYDQMIEEMNTMPRRPDFAVLDGDLVGSPTSAASWDNFIDSTLMMRFLPILIYGNHDGNPASGYYSTFQDKQEIVNGTRDYMFSFNCGQWHFVTIPCDVEEPDENSIVEWLEQDLYRYRNRPTMIFEHEHMMPQGLTRLEWYTYRRPFRTALLNVMAKYGNVRYVVCGHVHNGIKTSVKTAWSWKGIKFITAPTCTASRPFGEGEEYHAFSAGLNQYNGDTGGGYYMVFEVADEDVTIKARLANVDAEYVYNSDGFPEYLDQEPLWFKSIWDYTPTASFENGSFENDLEGWMMPHKYPSNDPVSQRFKWAIDKNLSRDGGKSLYMWIREGGENWANTEYLQFYQWVQSPANPLLKFSYYLDRDGIGGGCYARVYACNDTEMKHMFLLDWNATDNDKYWNRDASRNGGYEIRTDGRQESNTWYMTLGQQQKAMFWTLPETLDTWHDVTLNMPQVYDALKGSGAWPALGVTRLFVSVHCWTNKYSGSMNDTWVDAFSLSEAAGELSNVDGTPLATDNSVWQTQYGGNWA